MKYLEGSSDPLRRLLPRVADPVFPFFSSWLLSLFLLPVSFFFRQRFSTKLAASTSPLSFVLTLPADEIFPSRPSKIRNTRRRGIWPLKY